MSKLTELLKSQTVGISTSQNVVVLKKDIFPSNVDAGMIDQFIETNFPNLINRNENEVNGVSVTRDEIVITLSHSIDVSQLSSVVSLLENKVW